MHVLANLCRKMRMRNIRRARFGDVITVQMSPYDLSKAPTSSTVKDDEIQKETTPGDSSNVFGFYLDFQGSFNHFNSFLGDDINI